MELLDETVDLMLLELLAVALEWLLLDGEVECTLDRVLELELEWEVTVECALDEPLVAELDGEALLDEDETLVDEDEVDCAELDEAWLDEVTCL